jgi:hypothetical protein
VYLLYPVLAVSAKVQLEINFLLQAPKKIAAWLLKRQLPSNPDDRGTTRKIITLLTTAVKTCIRLLDVNVVEFLVFCEFLQPYKTA